MNQSSPRALKWVETSFEGAFFYPDENENASLEKFSPKNVLPLLHIFLLMDFVTNNPASRYVDVVHF